MAAALAAGMGLARSAAARTLVRGGKVGRRAPGKRPRYLLQFMLSGGIDPIFTTDPRRKGDVESGIDVPYEPASIHDTPHSPLGPHLASFAPVIARIALVSGVRLDTANHHTGQAQFRRLRTQSQIAMPTAHEIWGSLRDPAHGPPLAMVENDWLKGTCDFVLDQGAGDLRALADALEGHARRHSSTSRGEATLGTYTQTAGLLRRVAASPRWKATEWSHDADQQFESLPFQRLLWLMENDAAAAYFVNVGGPSEPWDSHYLNEKRQERCSQIIFPMMARFIAELGRRRNAFGNLFDQTLLVIGSEIGRFPRLNDLAGKDHFPETPFMLLGGCVAPGRYGTIGRQMESLRVSARDGTASASGIELRLDDIGTTVMHLGGVADPSVYGYRGRVLEFLL
jgi:hypothetical protein